MRYSVIVCLALLLRYPLAAAEPEGQPIPVVVLDRKEPVVYETDIAPILENRCYACHSGPVKKGELDLSTHASLMKGGKRGAGVVPGKSADSMLIKLAGKIGKPFMPPRGEAPLTPQELALLKLWIDQGAKPPSAIASPNRIAVRPPAPAVRVVRAVVITPDKSLVVASRANQIDVFDSNTGSRVRSLGEQGVAHRAMVESLALSPDGKFLASGSFQEVGVWDLASGEVRHKLMGLTDRVVTVAFSPDGKLLAAGGGSPTVAGEIAIFDLATGKVLTRITNGHSDTVFGVSFSPDGTRIASCGADSAVRIFEVATGKLVKTLEGHTHHVLDVCWRGDGKLLASAGADRKVRLWDYETGEQLNRINRGGGQINTTMLDHEKQVSRVTFIGQTSQLASSGGDQPVRLWNLEVVEKDSNVYTPYIRPRMLRTFGDGKDYLHATAVSADATLLAAGGEDGVIRLYDAAKGQLLRELSP